MLADYVGRHLIPPGSRVFIVSGTTACETARVILKKVRDVHVFTNSVPVAWNFMEMVERGECAPHVTVSTIGGEVRAVTGAISGKPETDRAATLIFAPHGLTEKAIVGNRDVDEIKKLVDIHQNVIMPVSWSKFGRAGSYPIKHYGHWKQVNCQMVLMDRPHPSLGLSEKDQEIVEGLLLQIQDAMGSRLRIHRLDPTGKRIGTD